MPMTASKPTTLFTKFAKQASIAAGRPMTFGLALVTILVWSVCGPIFGYSDTWQLIINTGTTIVTFLMVFLIQNTQNRDSEAIQIKLDELIRTAPKARVILLDLEELEQQELDEVRNLYIKMAAEARERNGTTALDSLPPDED
jgi:low affinity Fe/Cu permease